MERYGLTANELFVIRLILLACESEGTHYLSQYLSQNVNNKAFLRECLHSIRDKHVIIQEYHIPEEGENFFPREVKFSQNFIKNLYKAANTMGKELFDAYPYFAYINGVYTPIRTVTKHFNSQEDAFWFYGKSIKHNPELHNHILELLKWAIDNTQMINCSFSSFIINKLWESIEALKNGDQGNINFETVRML